MNRKLPNRVHRHMMRDAFGSLMMPLLGLLMCGMLLSACSMFGVRSGTEQAPYTVIAEIADDTEVRRYPSWLVAETSVSAAGEKDARNKAFRTLFNYISGANQSQAKVAMTSPVQTATEAEKIAMSAPVEARTGARGQYTMRFFLPADYTRETAPQPTNPNVRIIELPEQTIAVLRFSGSRGRDTIARRSKSLEDILTGSGWRPYGESLTMFYDPPWAIPAFRRNEVGMPVVEG